MSNTLCLHRLNPDNTWDSVCPRCSLIIARENTETELADHEQTHICDPAVIRRPPITYNVFLHT